MRTLAVAVMAFSLGIAEQAAASDLSPVILSSNTVSNGGVLVDRDGQFSSGLGGSSMLRQGDRVVVRNSSDATLRYKDGCVVRLTPGQVTTIAGQSPCAAGAGGFQKVADTDQEPNALGVGLGVLAGAGIIAVSLGFAGVYNHHHRRPVSP
jgi:hypothetical protein